LSTARPIAAQPVVTVFISSATVVSRTGPNPSMYGDPLTFTATVTPASTPTGSVSFYDGGTCAAPGSTLASAVPLSGGQATYSSSTSSVGPHTILACYSGDATYASSFGSISQTVTTALATDGYGTMTVSPTGVTFGQSGLTLTFTFAVPAGNYD